MRPPALLLCGALLAAGALSRPAQAGVAFGFRVGWNDAGGDVFSGSGRAGDVDLFGLQAVFPLAPMIGLEIAGEARDDSLHFRGAGDLGSTFSGRGRWRDLSLTASLLVHLLGAAVGPLDLYVGGGAGLHMTEIDLRPDSPPTQSDFVERTERDRTRRAGHLLAGASAGLPVVPLSIFAEARYEEVSGSFQPDGFAAYAGLNLELP